MNSELTAFLSEKKLLNEASAIWGKGSLPLQISYYLSDELPPTDYITSVRCVLFRNVPSVKQVMVVRDATNNYHVIPGGRVKPGEKLLDTLRREVLEETGWTISGCSLFCVARFHHQAKKPIDYPYPYPDFIQLIYRAHAVAYDPEAKQASSYELETLFRPINEAKYSLTENSQLLILNAAMELEFPDDS